MSNPQTQLRPAMTALAAAIAFSSTPLFAQVDPAAPASSTTTPPVIDVPPPASRPSGLSSVTVPDIATGSAASATDQAAAARPASTRAAPSMRTTASRPASSRSAEAAARASSPTAAASAPPVTPAPAQNRADTTPAAAPVTPSPAATPAPRLAPTPAQATRSDDTLPIAGAAGFGLLALIGSAFAFGRRKQRHEGEEAPETTYQPTTYQTVAEPVIAPAIAPEAPAATPRVAEPVPAAPVQGLPEGTDASRFGRHVQAAYAGPTPDNPSLSLRRRLKHAAFFDQRERMAAAQPATPEMPIAGPETTTPRPTGQTVSQPGKPTPRFSFRPAYQR